VHLHREIPMSAAMARVFISCNHRDFPQGELLQKELIALGHSMTLGVTAKPAGRWEVQLLRGVHDADVFISFLTPRGAASTWVVGQTGMAISCEYTRNQLVLPVCLPNEIPNFIAAFHCVFLNGIPAPRDHAASAAINMAVEV
jgi:TIR domain